MGKDDILGGHMEAIDYEAALLVQREHVVQVPFSLEDPDYKGLELDLIVLCEKHGKPSERLVAFEGTMTGRRFLACAEPEGQNCGFVQWVDEQWPPTMENALLKLWSVVEESKSARVNDNLKSALTIHHLTEEKKKLDADYDKLVKDVHQLVNFQQDRVVDFSYLQSAVTYQHQCRAELVAGMKAEMAKKDAATEKFQQKYEILCNLTSAQAIAIQNLKLKNMKEKELMSEAMMNLELKNAEFTSLRRSSPKRS
ncbi:hypothetical protein CFC21_095445 [Triticum aestivum]|uniref:GRF-type domain-containing protein n=2 Tax=Triticum aestivum TaxID=4565 RepID=A0A9R1LQ44_WHEAT|nr:uncharacterized protein LOC123152450 [Triticum aestivum]XP_044427924.1 uncharacterized protein LOC123152450 [Triticum aestivum]KAF7093004.1 hypothetical protein CFC21_095444 [Triticum aestivum]KAF7093006.1 hypothetical protein CFC21_095445 [Triticum aestivum]